MANWASTAALGDPSSPEWQAQNLTWIEPIKGQRWQVYKPAEAAFAGLLGDLVKLGYHPTSSGGYNYRNIRGSDRLSQHAFGTAIDLNAMTNARGQSATDIPHAAELAKKWGLEWGGTWKNPDPMHFEYTGGGAPAGGGGAAAQTPQEQWAAQMWPMAVQVSQQTGIDPRVIMSQAALETGWGKSAPNNNYFGIKGKGAGQKTLEFVNGKMTPTEADFRAYQNPQEAFTDYGNVMMGSRYAGVRSGADWKAQIEALGKSGYATDPDYASKLMAIAQGFPEGGYGAGNPNTALAAAAATGAAGGLGKAVPGPKKGGGDWSSMGAAIADMGKGGDEWKPTQAPAIAAARVDAPTQGLIDPQQTEQRRQQLAMLMQRLNQGSLV